MCKFLLVDELLEAYGWLDPADGVDREHLVRSFIQGSADS